MDVVRVRLNYAHELRPEAFPLGLPLQCLVPNEQLVPGDVMLAKKIVLENNERGALAVANFLSPSWH